MENINKEKVEAPKTSFVAKTRKYRKFNNSQYFKKGSLKEAGENENKTEQPSTPPQSTRKKGGIVKRRQNRRRKMRVRKRI